MGGMNCCDQSGVLLGVPGLVELEVRLLLIEELTSCSFWLRSPAKAAKLEPAKIRGRRISNGGYGSWVENRTFAYIKEWTHQLVNPY